MAAPHDITRLLREWANGAPSALETLTPLVYAELRRLAGSYMRSEAPGHTLQPTALVHEAFLRMVARDAPDCQNRSHFYGVASHLMRQILIDHARTRHAGKRGGGRARISLEENLVVSREREADLVALDDALERLSALDPRKTQVVELRFFGGLSVEESAEVLKVSEVTVGIAWATPYGADAFSARPWHRDLPHFWFSSRSVGDPPIPNTSVDAGMWF